MKIKRYLRTLSLCLLVAAGTFGCDMDYDKEDNTKLNGLMLGMGCMTTSPITMKSTTYDMENNITSTSMQVINNMSVQSSQPNMTSMYEMYGGVEIEINLDFEMISKIITQIISGNSDSTALMAYVKQNPLLTQFWALKKMASSTNAGKNGTWMDSDDTIDPILGYFETTQVGDRYQQIVYSDFGKTPSNRIDYVVENNRKVKSYLYEAGANGTFGDSDDVLVKTTVYQYNSTGKMTKAVNYSDDETTFKSVYIFSYDAKGRLESMTSYDGADENDLKNRMTGGSYSFLKWNDTGATPVLDIELGIRLTFLGSWDQQLINFHYEFNSNGTIHKMIQYKPLSKTKIDTSYVYNYSNSFLGMGQMNDSSNNYSDDEKTQVSHTVNELIFGEN